MICLWYIIERLDKTIGWLERPGTVKSHLTKLNGIQYTVYIQFKKWHWCRVINMYEGEDCQSLPRVLFGMSPWGLQWDSSRADMEVRQMAGGQICIYTATISRSGFFFALSFSRTETSQKYFLSICILCTVCIVFTTETREKKTQTWLLLWNLWQFFFRHLRKFKVSISLSTHRKCIR